MRTAFLALSMLQGSACCAQWTTVHLHPSGFQSSEITSVSGGQQGGWGFNAAGQPRALVWQGTGASAVDLGASQVRGVSNGMQVGKSPLGATIWYGTPESIVSLNPPGYAGSELNAIAGSQQVGLVGVNGQPHAAVWQGTPESVIDLHPAGMLSSQALATDGQMQGGRATVPSGIASYAALWSGTAESFVNMNPAGAISSVITGMAPGEQVGWANFGAGVGSKAILWRGSPESAVNMHPTGLPGISQLMGTCGSAQVGVYGGGIAGIWFGTPDSFHNLAQYLPAGYGISVATSVTEHNGLFYVGGYAYNQNFQREAFLWVGVPAPGSAAVLLTVGVLAWRRKR